MMALRRSIAAAVALLVSGPASAQVDPTPLVFIVLDTSGSMSYTEVTGEYPACVGLDASVPTSYGKSRDIVAKEVLTGTFDNYSCLQKVRTGYHDGYPIPWFVPVYTGQQDDGVLGGTNMTRFKFALMTFDNILAPDTDEVGGWSLGPDKPGLFGLSAINVGGMNGGAAAGKLIIPSASESAANILTGNTKVRNEILKAIPFGGTPISPALDDVLDVLENATGLKKKSALNPSGDPYASCRPVEVLLITDGRPTLGEGDLGYPTSVKAAEKLFLRGHKVHVVGFNLAGTETGVADAIADAGGTVKAHRADTPAQLSTAISEILGKTFEGVRSRTDIVVTNVTNSLTDLQYQVNSGYEVSKSSPLDLSGVVEMTAYRCEDACRDPESGGAGGCEVTSLAKRLNKQLTRDLRWVLDGKLRTFHRDDAELTADRMGVPTSGQLPSIASTLTAGVWVSDGANNGPATDENNRIAYRGQIIDLIRGETGTRRQSERLGGLFHSTPAVQTNLSSLDVGIPSFAKYKASIAARPTMMYFVTHDGFLHAIHLSQPAPGSDYDWLEEVWAIAPQMAVKRMERLVTKTQFILDGAPVLKDIRLSKPSADVSLDDEAALWRSVLVVPFREEPGMFAVDVTDPTDPKVLWEIDNERRCWRKSDGDTECKLAADGDEHDYSRLGKTIAKPKVGTLFVTNDKTGATEEVAAVFFPCGTPVGSNPESGKCFMVTRLDNGKKLKEFHNGADGLKDDNPAPGNTTDTIDFPIVGDPAAFNTFIGTFVTRLFVGDDGGQLWRLDVSDKDPDNWKMQFFFDIYYDNSGAAIGSTVRAPIRGEPAMSPVPERGTLVLVFGAGDQERQSSTDERAVMYSVKEKLAIDPVTGQVTGTSVTAEVNWKRELDATEFLTSRPLIFGSVAYFTTFVLDPLDACQQGTGRIWGLHFLNTKPTTTDEPVPAFDADGDENTVDSVEYIELEASLPTGVNLVSRPACSDDSGIEASVQAGNANLAPDLGKSKQSALKSAKPGQLELVVQTGKTGKTNASATPAKGGTAPTVQKIHQKIAPPTKQVVGVGWGQLQNL